MITMSPTFSRKLAIVDVSGMLYTYTAASNKSRDQSPIIVKGVNIAGVKAVLEFCAMCYRDQKRVVLCLDTFSDKKNMNSEYKANRTFVPEIAYQSDIIDEYFKSFGVEVMRKNGYEADDLIYSLVYSNIDKFNSIEVYTGDKDIYGCIMSSKVTIIGINSQSPSIDINNYEVCVDSKVNVPFNCILPHLTLYGKPSNNLKKLQIDNCNKNYFEQFVQMMEREGTLHKGSDINSMISFLSSGIVRDEHISIISERSLLVYPRIVKAEVDLVGPVPDTVKISQFCSFFKQMVAARMYGVINYMYSVPVDNSMSSVMKQIFSSIKNGTKLADLGLYDGTVQIYETQEFTEVEDW